jgi:hypothetical protein
MAGNKMRGVLPEKFDADFDLDLEALDLSSNAFSGELTESFLKAMDDLQRL